jgi:hypothetical protein
VDEQGKVVEKGEAIKGRGDWWEYVPTTEGKLAVEAGHSVSPTISPLVFHV